MLRIGDRVSYIYYANNFRCRYRPRRRFFSPRDARARVRAHSYATTRLKTVVGYNVLISLALSRLREVAKTNTPISGQLLVQEGVNC